MTKTANDAYKEKALKALISGARFHSELAATVLRIGKHSTINDAFKGLLVAGDGENAAAIEPLANGLISVISDAVRNGDMDTIANLVPKGANAQSPITQAVAAAMSKMSGGVIPAAAVGKVITRLNTRSFLIDFPKALAKAANANGDAIERYTAAQRANATLPRAGKGQFDNVSIIVLGVYATAHGTTPAEINAQLADALKNSLAQMTQMGKPQIKESPSQTSAMAVNAGRELLKKAGGSTEELRKLFIRHDRAAALKQTELLYIDSKPGLQESVREAMADILQVTGEMPKTLLSMKVIETNSPRAFASITTGSICLSTTELKGKDALWHEVGHHIEFSHPQAKAAAVEFIKRRGKGCKLARLSSLYPKAGYDKDEVAIVDSFDNHYISKICSEGFGKSWTLSTPIESLPFDITEVIAVGLQCLFNDLNPDKTKVRIAFGKDTEFREFIYGIIKMIGEGKFENLIE